MNARLRCMLIEQVAPVLHSCAVVASLFHVFSQCGAVRRIESPCLVSTRHPSCRSLLTEHLGQAKRLQTQTEESLDFLCEEFVNCTD